MSVGMNDYGRGAHMGFGMDVVDRLGFGDTGWCGQGR